MDEVKNDKNSSAGESVDTPKIGKHVPERYPASEKPKDKFPAKKKQITITFRENRTFELNLGHEVMRFEGRQTKAVDVSILKHPAFIQARKDFNIKGI